MIAYVDTSAIMPMLIEDCGTDAAATSGTRPSASSAPAWHAWKLEPRWLRRLASAGISARQLESSKHELDGLLGQLDLVDVDNDLVRRAGDLGETHALRVHDAAHLAAAQRVFDGDLVRVAADRALLTAAEPIGMAIATVG